MNITPLEIRQKVFEKVFRGYDKDEVSAFLNSMSIEWEKLNDLNKELRIKLEASQKEVEKLREVENSLFKTLKTAEDTGANMVEQATKTAELHMKETEMKADALMSEAKSRAKSIIEDAEAKARVIVDDMEDEIRELEQVFRSLDANKSTLMSELKMLANDIIDKVSRHSEFPAEIKSHSKKAKELVREVNENSGEDQVISSMLNKEELPETESVLEESLQVEQEGVIESVDSEEKTEEVETNETVEEEVSEEEVVAEVTEESSEEETKKEKAESGGESFFDQID